MGRWACERNSGEASVAGEGRAGADGLELRRKELWRSWIVQCLPGVRACSMEGTGKPKKMEAAIAGVAQNTPGRSQECLSLLAVSPETEQNGDNYTYQCRAVVRLNEAVDLKEHGGGGATES